MLTSGHAEHTVSWGHLPNVFLDVCCLILDHGADTHQSPAQ